VSEGSWGGGCGGGRNDKGERTARPGDNIITA